MKVKNYKVTTTPKDPDAEPFTSKVVHFDREGREIAHYDFAGPGIFESKAEAKFDADGQLLEEITYEDENQIAERKVYRRNEAGEVVRIDLSFSDGSESVRTVDKDLNLHTENIVEVDEDDQMESREFLQLSPDGLVLVREIYDYRDKLTEVFEYSYDEAGQLISRRQLDNRRKLLIETEYRYADDGQIEFRANRNRKGQLSDFLKMEFNEQGQVIRQNISGKYFINFQYDDQGNTVLEERYQGEVLDLVISFEYNNNNELVQEEYPTMIREYHYEYYED